jgi:hypothetical protein
MLKHERPKLRIYSLVSGSCYAVRHNICGSWVIEEVRPEKKIHAMEGACAPVTSSLDNLYAKWGKNKLAD